MQKLTFIKSVVFYSLIVSMLFASACNIKRLVPKNEKLLRKNYIKYIGAKPLATDLSSQIRLKPNARIFGLFPYKLWFYKKGTSFKKPWKNNKNRVRKWLREDLGEPPSILDTFYVRNSCSNLKYYLINSGYFDAQVTSSIKTKRHRGYVSYFINAGHAYTYDSIKFICEDSIILAKTKIIFMSSSIDTTSNVDYNKLDEERQKIALSFKNDGYYYFYKDLVSYVLDTNKSNFKTTLEIHIDDKGESNVFNQYRFKYVRINLMPVKAYQIEGLLDTIRSGNVLINRNHIPINASYLFDANDMYPDSIFRQKDLEFTYQNFAQTDLFKSVEIKITRDELESKSNLLNATILLSTKPRQVVSIEPQGITTDQSSQFRADINRTYGVANNINFTNRNIFKHGEKLNLNLGTQLELIKNYDSLNSKTVLQSIQQSVNLSLTQSRTYILKKLLKSLHLNNITSAINLSYIYEKNNDFIRKVLPASFGYQFIYRKLTFNFTPVEVSFNRNTLNKDFISRLNVADSQFVQRLFTDYLITAVRLGVLFNDRGRTKSATSFFIKSTLFETSGNLHRLIRNMSNTENHTDTSYNLFKVKYFQYIKSDIDFRMYTKVVNSLIYANRINIGIGLPYGNEKILPFEKRFFIGGTNSLRAWRPRRIGPGNFADTSSGIKIDRSGEFLFQINSELRFPLVKKMFGIPKFLESAIFLDIGNIWNLNHKGQTQKGILKSNNFIKEMAMNTGLGFRLNFSFFMFRFDWGIPLRDPQEIESKRWVIKNVLNKTFIKDYTIISFGLGYPF